MKASFVKKRNQENMAASLIRHLLLAWLIAAAAEFLLLPVSLRSMNGLESLAAMSLPRLLIVMGVVLSLLEALSGVMPGAGKRWMLPAVFAVLAAATLAATFTWALLAVCVLVFVVLSVYASLGWNGALRRTPEPEKSVSAASVTALLAVLFFLLVSVWTVARVSSFAAPTFDFGIFAQMFHSMRTSGLPITTVERDGALSHFAVHVSPIYYLLLPFYMIVPRPETLQVLQAAVLASAVIPLYLLGKRHGLPPFVRTALCALLLLYPAYAGGASYDIHENAFLTPLILWLFYGIDRKHLSLTAIFALLTMMVKEDAPVYVAVIALWLLLRGMLYRGSRWELRAGALLLVSSVAYFFAVTSYLAASGDGVMTYRYQNFMYDGSSSLLTVIKAVLLSPMKAVFECVDKEKLEFIGLTLLPLAGIPLLTRRYERLILLIPYILVNLMSDYQYQHDIFFQYTYGSTACLFYLVAVNLADMKESKLRVGVLTVALCVSASCFGAQILPKATDPIKNCKTYEAYYDQVRSVLDTVPDGASVAATTYYTAYLSQRDTLYDIRYASKAHIFSCDYIALAVKSTYSYKPFAVNGEQGYENFRDMILAQGYEKVAEYKNVTEIYKKK